jgi:ribosomal protein S18 acetylase RimI-like enzyme
VARERAPPSEVAIVRLVPEDWEVYRELRLRALREDPAAFGSTFAEESAFPQERWRERLARRGPSSPAVTWAARAPDGNLLGLLVAAKFTERFQLFAMWVAPEARRRSVGGRLLDAALAWVEEQAPGSPVYLEVNPLQTDAVRLYLSRGFRASGISRPLEHTPGQRVDELVRQPGLRPARGNPA